MKKTLKMIVAIGFAAVVVFVLICCGGKNNLGKMTKQQVNLIQQLQAAYRIGDSTKVEEIYRKMAVLEEQIENLSEKEKEKYYTKLDSMLPPSGTQE